MTLLEDETNNKQVQITQHIQNSLLLLSEIMYIERYFTQTGKKGHIFDTLDMIHLQDYFISKISYAA